MKMTHQDIYVFLKMSLFQFLLKNNFNFYNKDRETIFDLLTNDKKISVQNGITISQGNNLYITSWIAVKNKFMDIEKLRILSNYLNEFSGVFSSYVQEVENEDFSLFYIKASISPQIEVPIDEDFWKGQITTHINNVSSFTDFLFFEFPKTEFFITKEIDTKEFKSFFYNKTKEYIEALRILREQEIKNEFDYSHLTKEEIDKEIDIELGNFSKGEKNIYKLNMLVEALRKKESN